jgi:hypothetical protein
VESVDPLSIDEIYESIVADISDHGRRPSRAHFLPHILMNIRRCARGFRSQTKPTMIISSELYFFENLINQILNLEHIPMEPLAFYARCKVLMKSSRSYVERRSGAPYFLYAVMHVLKVVKIERYID